MATTTKPKIESIKIGKFVTPAGTAIFVSTPNASQHDDSKQEGSIILTAADLATFKNQIIAEMKLVEGDFPGGLTIDTLSWPITKDTDKDGNETGNFKVKAKTAMIYPAKVFDSEGKAIEMTVGYSIPNRSKIRLAVGVEVCSSKMYNGVVLRLNAIKVIQLNQGALADPFAGYEDGDAFGEEDAVVNWED